MSKTIGDACRAVVTVLRAANIGIRAIPDADKLPENTNIFPFAAVRPGAGEWTFESSDGKKWLGEIIVELHVSRKDLPTAVYQALDYADTVPNALFYARNTSDTTLFHATTGPLDTFGSIFTSALQPLGWGDVATIGYQFTISGAKIRLGITAP